MVIYYALIAKIKKEGKSMNQEKIGQFLKSLRKKHNLTQKQFADKYNVTYLSLIHI